MRCPAILTAATVLVLAGACSQQPQDGTTSAVPLPRAYPRIHTYPALYTVYPSLPVALSLNSAVTPVLKPGRTPGLDIPYPRYNATVYLTVIPHAYADFDRICNARRARITANLGGIATSAMEVTSQADTSFVSAIVLAKSATQTPVQLLGASRRHGIIVSATAFLHDKVKATNLDSISPAIEALARDMLHLATDLALPSP